MKKDLLIVCVIAVVITFLALGTKIQSVDDYYLTHLDEIQEGSETVFLSIDCKKLLDPENLKSLDPNLRDEKYVPLDGVILHMTEYVLRPNDTVFHILDRAVRHNKIPMVYQKAPLTAYNSVYIQGINHLFQFSCGELSGWAYIVNGEYQSGGSGAYKLKDGDVIEWKYTCDLGRDLGGDMGQ